jgi:hypothetical protein
MSEMQLVSCPQCQRHHYARESACPFCATPRKTMGHPGTQVAKAMMAAMTPMVLAACYGVGNYKDLVLDSGEPGGGTGGSSDDTGGGGGDVLDISVNWGADAVTVTFGAPVSEDHSFGMAETAESDDPWTGEDCLNGYTLSDGTVLGPYCHKVSAGTDTLELTYGGNASDLQPGATVFGSDAFDGKVTYVLFDEGEESCWTWGEDPSYYASLGCTEL